MSRLRAWWLRRQGLTPEDAPKTLPACLRLSGWLPTSGSTGIYLSIRARMPGVSREAVDRAAMDGVEIVEVAGAHGRPSVVVPLDEVRLALRIHAMSYEKHLAPLFASGAVSEAAFSGVGAQVCRALDEGPLSTAGIRASVRHPDAGELLVSVLNHLTVHGTVRRFPIDGKLDASKYMYDLRHPDDRPDLDAEGDADAVVRNAARHHLQHYGPATVDEIAWWGGLSKTAVRKALATLDAQPVPIAGWTDEAWLLPDDLHAWKSFDGDGGDCVVLLPYRDPFVFVRRPPAVLTGRGTVPVLNDKLNSVEIRTLDGLSHHTIVAGGEVVGIWEYDPKSENIVTRVWSTDRALRGRVADAVADTGRFISRQLGDAKLSAVDPPARRARRIAFCRSSRR